MSNTVWDYEADLPTPAHDPVDGKVSSPGLGLNLGVFADLALSIGNLVDRIDRQQSQWDRFAASIPGDLTIASSGIYPASGVLAINLGSPDLGSFWNVRGLIVGGSDITTSPAGIGWAVVMGAPPNANGSNVNLASVRDFTTQTLPQKAFYGTHQFRVDATEYLWMVITGGTAGTQYVTSVKLETIDMTAAGVGLYEE